ncbi:hypothetical protein LXL04_014798 [Taraxacum kok-saghyz]
MDLSFVSRKISSGNLQRSNPPFSLKFTTSRFVSLIIDIGNFPVKEHDDISRNLRDTIGDIKYIFEFPNFYISRVPTKHFWHRCVTQIFPRDFAISGETSSRFDQFYRSCTLKKVENLGFHSLMEALYSKLYDKYTRLKVFHSPIFLYSATKTLDIEQYNFDQEQKFKIYVSAADELIGYLKNEKDILDAQVIELRHELAAIRQGLFQGSAKEEEQAKYEHIISKENLKVKELSEEIQRLNRKESHPSPSNEIVPINQVSNSPISSSKSKTKRKRHTSSINEQENSFSQEPQNTLEKENTFSSTPIDNANQPKCCRRRLSNSVNGSESSMCMFQELVECLLDLKFSVATQSGETLMTAVHDSSGYTFNLGWMKNAEGEEELMYKVSSLGTFERVAPEWMRDMMLFSKSMSRVFFNKLSAIINRRR